MASNYPTSLDTTATLPAAAGVGANLSTFPHSALHGNADDAIIAIETELGVAPSGAETTVKARLDRITPTLGAFTSMTPTITQGVNVTFTTNHTAYIRVGRLVVGNTILAITGAGTASNPIVLTGFPAALAWVDTIGSGYIFDTSAATTWPVRPYFVTTTQIQFHSQASTATMANLVMGSGANAMTAALASGDSISFNFTYEAGAD